MKIKNDYSWLWVSLFFTATFIVYFWISLPDYSGDIKNHVVWGKSIAELGTWGFYQRTFPGFSFPTYPPFIMLFFGVCYWLYQSALSSAWFLNNTLGIFPSNLVHFFEWEHTLISFLKIPGFIGAILTGGLIYKFLDLVKKGEVKKKRIITLLFLFNPAVIYLSAVWGQTDLLQYFFVLLGMYLLFKDKFWWAVFFASLGLLSKQTAIVMWGIFIFTVFLQQGIKKSILAVIGTVVMFYLAYFPFNGFSLTWPIRFYQANFELVNFLLSENSVNIWALIFQFKDVDSSTRFLSITLDMWGNLMFAAIALPATFLLWRRKFRYEFYFQYLFLISISYFYFLSRMHERYLIPAVIFSALLLFWGKKYYVNFIFFTLLHFINLYRGLFVPSSDLLTFLARNILFLDALAILYGGLVIYNFYVFYRFDKASHENLTAGKK